MRANARQAALARFDLKTVCLPQMPAFLVLTTLPVAGGVGPQRAGSQKSARRFGREGDRVPGLAAASISRPHPRIHCELKISALPAK